MSFSKLTTFAGMVAAVSAHGYVSGIVAGGTYYTGWLVSYAYQTPEPDSIGWADTNLDLGFTSPSAYTTGDIICAKEATNAALSATIAAGDSIDFQWTVWPESHHGPVITYLANCNGDCATVDKTTLEFFKIDEAGLIDDTTVPGTWASDNLIANNNTWTTTIPADLAPGNYVARHEIIALHSAGSEDGAQNYPQCINLEVTGSGTLAPEGTLGEALYTPTDPGILVNIYAALTYTIPGPAMYNATGAATVAASGVASATSAAASVATSAAVVATSAAASSVAAVTSAAASVAISSAAGAVVSTTAAPTTMITSVAPAATSAAASDDDETCDA
ncbi:putative glycoside hydrolase family 61 protein [Botrytis fragariae]|uniref:Putative glycoside hydrolase family 61 protein n=1 Tax=Botrytis fragariae TaxID=1964551 RepID=A0A8H6EIB3_9HELO|nr:putative glycoside hydrolase family 61 protein [Botrytis fragariae]KAF5873302.1 putative glycoside hydrolase family 61 protein [Botrytis fragariae]